MEYAKFIEDFFGVTSGPFSSFENLKRAMGGLVDFVDNINKSDILHIHEMFSPSHLFGLLKIKPYVVHAHNLFVFSD